jgi:hypothetical protein
MRRATLFVVLTLALLAGCGGDGKGDDLGSGVPDRTRAVPADVRSFLERVADPTSVAFHATYHLLTKSGGAEHVIDVTSAARKLTVTIDGKVVDLADQAALSAYGIFAGFLGANPAAAVESAARRADADDAAHTKRTVAGVSLDCIAVPVQDVTTSELCITRDGIAGYVDNPAARYELTAYQRT